MYCYLLLEWIDSLLHYFCFFVVVLKVIWGYKSAGKYEWRSTNTKSDRGFPFHVQWKNWYMNNLEQNMNIITVHIPNPNNWQSSR